MIDLTNVYEIRNVLDDKEIDKIEDELGNVIYEAFKLLPMSGIPPLTLQKCKGVDLVDYKIYGESVQNGEPTPDTPIEVESVGDLVTDESNENYGKYKIPVKVNDITTNIYLNEPLRKIGDYADYIDFVNSNVIRQVGHIEFDGTEDFWSSQKVTAQKVCSILKTDIGTNSTIIPALSGLIRSNYFNLSTTLNVAELGQLYSGVSYINFNLDDTNDLTTFKNWLSTQYLNGTPVALEYPLAEGTTEDITLPTISTNEGTNIIEVVTAIAPSNMEVKYYAKGVS